MSKLGSILRLKYGAALSAENRTGWGYPVFGSNGEVGRHAKYLIGEAGIVVGRKGSVGQVSWSDEPYWPIDTAYWVDCCQQDRRWLYWLLSYLPLKRLDTSTGVPGLNRNDVYELDVCRPEPASRDKIAEILDTFDAAIRGAEAVVAKLKAIKQGLLHDLLTRGIDANGDLRPSQPEAPDLYKQTPLGWLPKEWNTYKLPGLAQSNRPVIKTGPFGSSLKGEHWRETGRPVITIGSFGESGFIEDELLFIDEKKAKSMIEYEVHPGDLVFSRVADVGRSLVVEENEAGWIMSSNLMRICVERKKLLPALLHIQLRHSVRLRKQMSQLVNSAGRDVANSAVLLALDIAVPPGFEQIEIEKAIVCNDEKLVKEEQQLNKLRLQKSGLMDDLLTGRRPVTALL